MRETSIVGFGPSADVEWISPSGALALASRSRVASGWPPALFDRGHNPAFEGPETVSLVSFLAAAPREGDLEICLPLIRFLLAAAPTTKPSWSWSLLDRFVFFGGSFGGLSVLEVSWFSSKSGQLEDS